MTAQGCVRWQGELAMQALGKLEPDAATALQAHLDGCAACREEAAELAPLAAALAAASPDVFDDPEAAPVPARLQQSVLARLDAEAQSEHRRARRRVGAAAAAVAAAASVAAIFASVGSSPPAGRLVALTGAPGTVATMTLTRSSTGTDVTLHEHGQPVGRDFVVTMESASGSWWQAGSYHTSGTNVRAQLTCAVAPSEISRVWIRDSSGATVLSGYVH
jgi:hypothetical protein